MCIAERERVGCVCVCGAGRRTGEIDWIGVKFEVKMKTLFEENTKKKIRLMRLAPELGHQRPQR